MASLNKTQILIMSTEQLNLYLQCVQLKCWIFFQSCHTTICSAALTTFTKKDKLKPEDGNQVSEVHLFDSANVGMLIEKFQGDDLASSLTFRSCQLCSASADWMMEPTVITNRCLSLTCWSHFATRSYQTCFILSK